MVRGDAAGGRHGDGNERSRVSAASAVIGFGARVPTSHFSTMLRETPSTLPTSVVERPSLFRSVLMSWAKVVVVVMVWTGWRWGWVA